MPDQTFGDLIKKHDEQKAAAHRKQQADAEAQRLHAIEARKGVIAWYEDGLQPTVRAANGEMGQSGAAFEFEGQEVMPGHLQIAMYLTRNAFRSHRYVFYAHDDKLRIQCEINDRGLQRNMIGRPQGPLINERSALNRYANVSLAEAGDAWIGRVLHEILEENLASL